MSSVTRHFIYNLFRDFYFLKNKLFNFLVCLHICLILCLRNIGKDQIVSHRLGLKINKPVLQSILHFIIQHTHVESLLWVSPLFFFLSHFFSSFCLLFSSNTVHNLLSSLSNPSTLEFTSNFSLPIWI